MPLYEYKCSQCGQTFEVLQKFSDAPLTVHEGCGGAVEKLISTSALQFKGSGFYITDYNKKSSSPAGSSANGSSTNGSASTSSSSDSSAAKPAASTSDKK